MNWRKRHLVPILGLVVLGAAASPLIAAEDLILTPAPPSARLQSHYEGPVRIAVGTVSDGTTCLRPGLMGVGPVGKYGVFLDESWAEATSKALEQMLETTGLLATDPAQASHTVDVVLRRSHLFTASRPATGQVFLEFVFRHDAEIEGRLLTCGMAERSPFRVSQKTIATVYQEAFEDALLKLFESQTLATLLGEGWHPEVERQRTRRPAGGPAAGAFRKAEERQAPEALRAHRAARLLLREFEVEDAKALVREGAEAPDLGHYLPVLVREHLEAFYPGALESAMAADEEPTAGDVVVSGQILRFKKGNIWKKSMIGYGAGKDKLDVVVQLRDGASGEELLELHRVSSDWGTSAWSQAPAGQPGFSLRLTGPLGGPVEEMADQMARDLASFFVRHLADDYQYPEDLEVIVDWPEEGG